MSWNILDAVGLVFEALDLLGSGSSKTESLNYNESTKSSKRKESKCFVEWVSTSFVLISCVLLFIVFKDPLLVDSLFQTVCIAILIGFVIAFICCFAFYIVEFFYFKSFFSMLFFCTSMIVLGTASVLCLYFRAGLF